MQDINLSVPFRGDASKAMHGAISTLLPHGFRIVRQTATDVEFEGPPFPFQRGSLYWGASRCRLKVADGQLQLVAEMDIMRRSNKLGLVISVVAIACLAILAVVSAIMSPATILLSLAVIIGLPCFVALLAAFVIHRVRTQTDNAYDTLLKNATHMGASGAN